MNYEHLGADQSGGGINYGAVAQAGVEEGVKDIVKYSVIFGTILMIGSFFLKGRLIKKLERDLL